MSKDFSVTIKEASKELSAIERIKLKDLTDAKNINNLVDSEGEQLIDVDMFALLEVHNERSDDKDYEQFLIVAKDGSKYYTGSGSFIEAFYNIYDELKQEGIEDYTIKCYGVESKNYKGRLFLSCSLA